MTLRSTFTALGAAGPAMPPPAPSVPETAGPAAPTPAIQPPAPAGPRPRVRATRARIDDRFPSLSLVIYTADKSHFEVLLASDPTLFDPAGEDRRTDKNFFSSRRTGGLLRAEGGPGRKEALYVVPSAALKALKGAKQVFYSVVAYDDESGAGASRAHADPGQAPSVEIAPDFEGRTLGRMLSVPLENLRRVDSDGRLRAYQAEPLMQRNGYHEPDGDPDIDAGEGEDGGDYEMGYGESLGAVPVEDEYDDLDAEPFAGAEEDNDYGYEEGDEASDDYPTRAFSAGDDFYDDGFGALEGGDVDYDEEADEYEGDEDSDYAAGQSSGDEDEYLFNGMNKTQPASALGGDYPAGASAPEMLEDEDLDDEDEEPYEDPRTAEGSHQAASYGDEAEDYDDEPAFESLDAAAAPSKNGSAAPAKNKLTIDAQKAILRAVGQVESGEDFSAVKANAGYNVEGHPAYRRYLTGLDYGYVGFNQDAGDLGKLLSVERKEDKATFDRIFGGDVEELLRVLGAAGPPSKDSPGGRSARVQPVAGKDLWEEPWVARFREAGKHTPFQAAQLKTAASLFLEPMLPLARSLGLNTDRALAMLVDRAVDMGVAEAQQWVTGAVSPAQTPAQRQQALGALGYDDVTSFQQDVGLAPDGRWDARTQAAVLEALADDPAASPVPVPGLNEKLDAMVRAAEREPFAARVAALRHSNELEDVAYQL